MPTLRIIIAILLFGEIICQPINSQSGCNGNCSEPSVGVTTALLNQLFQSIQQTQCDLNSPRQWPDDFANEALAARRLDYDFVIAGSGTAGSILASRLSENPKYKILLLEAGGDPPLESEISSLSATLHHTSYMWTDYSEPNCASCQGMKAGGCVWPRGKMIGGSGSANGNIFLLGNRDDYERWVSAGNPGWSWDDLMPYYKKAINDGNLILNNFEHTKGYEELEELMFNATDELGLSRFSNLDQGTRVGYTVDIPATIENGRRMSTAKTYLGPAARACGNLDVIKNAQLLQIKFNNKRKVVGIEFILKDQRKLSVNVRKEVILAAGAINTPQLLMLSGIGPRRHLDAMKIRTRVDSPVAENMQDHGMLPLMLTFEEPIQLPQSITDPLAIAEYFLHLTGPLSTTFSMMGFINSRDNDTSSYPNIHLTSHTIIANGSTASFRFLGVKDELIDGYRQTVNGRHVLQIMGALLRPKTRGMVRLRSSNPNDPPRIFHNYADNDEDKAALLYYVRFVQNLTQTTTFKRYGLKLVHFPIEECDTKHVYDTDAYWHCYVKYMYMGTWHPVGTCPMGPLKNGAVVDSELRVHGVTGLRVVDASVMPTITSGNTNGPTLLIAEKGADMIAKYWKKKSKIFDFDTQKLFQNNVNKYDEVES